MHYTRINKKNIKIAKKKKKYNTLAYNVHIAIAKNYKNLEYVLNEKNELVYICHRSITELVN